MKRIGTIALPKAAQLLASAGLALCLSIIGLPGVGATKSANAQDGLEPAGVVKSRMVALGTGMPLARRSQAATCWLLELGNGDKFLFDIGTGRMANFTAQMIPFDFVTKIFLTHLHTDHWGDLASL